MQARLDSPDLTRLQVDLMTAAPRLMAALVPVAHRAGGKIKSDIRRNASGHTRLPRLASAVNYDLNVGSSEVEVVVGFDKTGQGNLANIAVYGTEDTAPFVDIDTPLASEVGPFMQWLGKAAEDAL